MAGCIPRLRLQGGECFADVVEDRRSHPALFLSIVQKHGSNDILFLGQFLSQAEAETAAIQFMDEMISEQSASQNQDATSSEVQDDAAD